MKRFNVQKITLTIQKDLDKNSLFEQDLKRNNQDISHAYEY